MDGNRPLRSLPEREPGSLRDTLAEHSPIPKPPDVEPRVATYYIREVIIQPISHLLDIPNKLLMAAKALGAKPDREAVNVNAFDEVAEMSAQQARHGERRKARHERLTLAEDVTAPLDRSNRRRIRPVDQ